VTAGGRSLWRAVVAGLLAAAALLGPVPGPSAAAPADGPGRLHLQTVPPLAGVVVQVDGTTARSDSRGRITVRVRTFAGLGLRLRVPATRIAPDREVIFDRFRGDPDGAAGGKVIQLGLRTRRLVSWQFMDRFGGEVPVARVHSVRIRSNTGEIAEVSGPQLARPRWVSESRTQQGPNGLVSKQLYWVVDSATVGGTSVVNKAQQRFLPWNQQRWVIQLLFYRVVFTAGDLFFTRQVGDGIDLVRPDGTAERLPFGADGTVSVADLPRGTYLVKAYGSGVSFARPVSISKDQELSMDVISRIDLGLVIGVLLAVAVGLILLGRPHLRPPWRRSGRSGTPPAPRGKLPRSRAVGGSVLALLLGFAGAAASARPARAEPPVTPVPVFAYYYIWFNPTSWNRAKIDYPLLGRYSSDDVEVMRRHVRMAKAAGITGFLVSWKHTPQLDERLAKLTAVARSEGFHLGIVYQGLNFDRQPLPAETVRQDLQLFAARYAHDPVYQVFAKPVVQWTGSTRFGRDQIDATVRDVRRDLLVLGDARSVAECEALTPVLDGQAYYWSSVDPTRGTGRDKLLGMAGAVHRAGGLWFAPIAPGFDARLVGGTRTVPRRDGVTLRASYDAAVASGPDAIGVISWNEFSENTHVEPSQKYGNTDLTVLADLLGAGPISPAPMDSSDDTPGHSGLTSWGALALLTAAAGALPLTVAVSRRRRAAQTVEQLAHEIRQLPRGEQ